LASTTSLLTLTLSAAPKSYPNAHDSPGPSTHAVLLKESGGETSTATGLSPVATSNSTCVVKRASTSTSPVGVKRQVPAPPQAPDQPANADSSEPTAVSATAAPEATPSTHSLEHVTIENPSSMATWPTPASVIVSRTPTAGDTGSAGS